MDPIIQVDDSTAPWTEVENGGVVRFEFDGVDAAARDALELKHFRGALSTPNADEIPRIVDINDETDTRSGLIREDVFQFDASSPPDRIRFMAMLASIWFGCAVAIIAGGLALRDRWSVAQTLTLMVGIAGLTAAFAYARYRNQKALPPPLAEHFIIELGEPGLTVYAEPRHEVLEHIALDAIGHVEGHRRIIVVEPGGRQRELSCALSRSADHVRLAKRINEILPSARAAAGDYRGR